ncbi:Adhesion G-protein coupled receptor G2 [Frankliniella fusca]|uniref:Adhesion G-protein coupled receptor G2 n=1 Tax=Frankliniella fusca TaxID=407009 RepID=A0AAE1H345_9NEOP|nr:Adhesion G-protein coupled receptor G2 [Frankliniella fusca]
MSDQRSSSRSSWCRLGAQTGGGGGGLRRSAASVSGCDCPGLARESQTPPLSSSSSPARSSILLTCSSSQTSLFAPLDMSLRPPPAPHASSALRRARAPAPSRASSASRAAADQDQQEGVVRPCRKKRREGAGAAPTAVQAGAGDKL